MGHADGAAGRTVRSARSGCGVESKADLLHRRYRGPDCPARPPTLPRQAHECEGDRTSVKPRPDAVSAPPRLRGDPRGRRRCAAISWISLSAVPSNIGAALSRRKRTWAEQNAALKKLLVSPEPKVGSESN